RHVFENEKFMNDYYFSEYIHYLANHHQNGEKIKPIPGRICKTCEFKSDEITTLKSGFEECWQQCFSFDKKSCESPMILDIWNFSSLDKLIHSGICKASQIQKSDINIKESKKGGLSSSERQWLQIEKMQRNDMQEYLDIDGL